MVFDMSQMEERESAPPGGARFPQGNKDYITVNRDHVWSEVKGSIGRT
jgi:hypothetical protein